MDDQKYEEHNNTRKGHTDAVLNSNDHKRIILAGPGTGKSFLFQEICKKNIAQGKKNNLTLSFINELVDDLAKDLYNLSEVRTLHSFALGQIPGENKMYLSLGEIISNDYQILNNKEIDFKDIFCNLKEDKDGLDFYSKRRKYYNFFSPNCSVFTLLKIFEKTPSKIPSYSQILVDEFQDFNKLESKLLDFLSQKSPMLVAGDDDQSLYSFKHANPHDIRSKYTAGDYTPFQLPFCSRCTEVTISAFNNILDQAKKEGFLKSRTAKDYKYFPTKEKDKTSSENPSIILKKGVFQKSVAYNIDTEIKKIFDPRSKNLPSVLIICPLKVQIADLEKMLRQKGFKNIDASIKTEDNQIFEGFQLLLKDSNCNLGWRITAQCVYNKNSKDKKFKEILEESYKLETNFVNLVELDERKYIKKILSFLRKIKDETPIAESELKEVLDCLGYNPYQISTNLLQEELDQDSIHKNIYKDTPIKITTILGSKGLTKDYSFLVNFDDKYLLEKRPDKKLYVTDENICKFLVALTRAKTKTYIFTGQNKPPLFVKWMGGKSYIEI